MRKMPYFIWKILYFTKKCYVYTILIILCILAVGAAVYSYLYKTGKINDRDGDYIPDEVEDTVDKGKESGDHSSDKIHSYVILVILALILIYFSPLGIGG